MTKLRLAIVGFGKIATVRHVPAITAMSDVELVAIADPDPNIRTQLLRDPDPSGF